MISHDEMMQEPDNSEPERPTMDEAKLFRLRTLLHRCGIPSDDVPDDVLSEGYQMLVADVVEAVIGTQHYDCIATDVLPGWSVVEGQAVASTAMCRCGAVAEPLHPCLYKEEISGDSETTCNCCDGCRQECAWDI